MARKIIPINRYNGLSSSEKEGPQNSYLWARSVNYRLDPSKLSILPRTTKISGTQVLGLPVDGDLVGSDVYFYDQNGRIYTKDSNDSVDYIRTVASSSGNGMRYFGEDKYLYYTSDKVIGRFGPIGSTTSWTDDFLGAEGGVALNTYSLDLESGSTQYGSKADTASLSITGDLTIEANTKFESLPTVGNAMTIAGKWNVSGNLRSYAFDLTAISGYFGDSAEGALTISSDTTQAPTDSACTGTAATYSLSATNASFSTGDKILIHQTRGTGAGVSERNTIAGYTAGTITVSTALQNDYSSGAQVIVLSEYTNVTVNSGKTWSAKAWNGTVGGILAFLASGTVTVTGTISATEKGFVGGTGDGGNYSTGDQGDGSPGTGSRTTAANGNGGGGGKVDAAEPRKRGGGGGGAGGEAGESGQTLAGGTGGTGGSVISSADLSVMVFGGGGGQGGKELVTPGSGGTGGGIIYIAGVSVVVTGSIISGGGNGANGGPGRGACGGAGGGSILIKAQTATLGAGLITAPGGTGGTGEVTYGGNGGDGGAGRIHLDYYTSYTGTTTPTLDVTQDNSLVTNTSYQLRLGISDDGTAEEFLTKNLESFAISQWYHLAVTWDASASQAEFFVDGESIGTSTGSKTAIDDNASAFSVGTRFNSSGNPTNLFDGKIDDVRLWNDIRTDTEIFNNRQVELGGSEANLQAYYKLNNSADDSTANANNLTLAGAPSYSTDVPFLSPTTRQDLDQSNDAAGNTYTTPTAISEAATAMQVFVPAKDPQKSIEVLIANKGTGNWTLTVHDPTNRVVASKTVTNANLHTGDFEFVFDNVWTPILGVTYHFHVTSTVADGTVTTGTADDLNDVDFHTYYQFLIENDYHPIEPILNKLAIGNGRYLALWDAITYQPHRLTLPSGWVIRSLARWREYLAIGCVWGDTLTDTDKGMIFFWDGVSDTYNFYTDVLQGGVTSMVSGDPLFILAGYSGDFLKYDGRVRRVRRLPKITEKKSIVFHPHAITMWKALVHFGTGETNSSAVEHGVYAYGSLTDGVAETMSFDYPLSVGVTQNTGIEVGWLFPAGSSLLIGWKYGSGYGLDIVRPTNDPFPTATYEGLITDGGNVWQEKDALTLRGYFKSLASGDTVTLKYKIDRESSFNVGDTESTVGKKEARLPMPKRGTRFNEIQYGVNLTTTNSDSPEFYSLALEYDDLAGERRV